MRTIGVDTGGTFTDLVLVEDGEVRAEKLPSTPADPSRAVLEGIASLGGADSGTEVVHGTTVALNALLTGALARTALVTNVGFRDLIEIGRQDRPDLYALHPVKAPPLVSRPLRYELAQRSWPDGSGGAEVVSRPTAEQLQELARGLAAKRVESVAVCLLHSYLDPAHEEEVAGALRDLGIPVTLSASILPEYREYERFSTCCVNAALVPLMQRYLQRLGDELGSARLSVLQSSGGTLPAARAGREPARILLSGPAGGVVGAARAAREAGLESIVTMDMGGTSADVAFHAAQARVQDAVGTTVVAGHPIGLPSLDIHTIGCGGGSLVRVDAGGILRVGPESAGADPGPLCYGVGDELTVTDAHVELGHIATGPFLGGRLELDVDAVHRGFERLGTQLGVRPEEAASAVLEVARAAMRRAIGVMTMQRGHDPKRLPLVAFGGAGGLQAAALATALGLPGALVPRLPGCLSAFGMAHADAVSDHARTILASLADWPAGRRLEVQGGLLEAGAQKLREAGFAESELSSECSLDLRYTGQSYELSLAESGVEDLAERFHALHAQLYGWSFPEREIELVSLRARTLVRHEEETPPRARKKALPDRAIRSARTAWLPEPVEARVIDREALAPGHHCEGPALIEEYSGTTLLPGGWTLEVTAGGHLWLGRTR